MLHIFLKFSVAYFYVKNKALKIMQCGFNLYLQLYFWSVLLFLDGVLNKTKLPPDPEHGMLFHTFVPLSTDPSV